MVESEDTSDKIYRPMEGMASLKSSSPLTYKNALWNGRKTAVTHEIMGHVTNTKEKDTYCLAHPG